MKTEIYLMARCACASEVYGIFRSVCVCVCMCRLLKDQLEHNVQTLGW